MVADLNDGVAASPQ